MRDKTKIEVLNESDTFFLDGKKYIVITNNTISTSFNEITAISEGENVNIRLRKDQSVYIQEQKTATTIHTNRPTAPEKIRNEKGNIIRVSFAGELTEQKLSKDQIKKRDECAKKLLDSAEFKERYNNPDNVSPPGRDINDVAYGICTNRATGRGNKQGSKSRKETNESFNRLNIISNILRRISK
tara:strand:- start:1319 stop:1873 length:555 start_codon:yes stop_codon:yes gene_type:complete